jgi:tripartite-type tricarboxylate transporter receptor subunit TctC
MRLLLCLAAVFALSGYAAQAQFYPNKPVRVIVAYGPGTVTDILMRLIGDKIAPELGQPVVVENRGGAGGAIAASAVARSPADGYTLLAHTMSGLAFGVTATIYDPLKDFSGIVPLANLITIIVGAKDKGFETLPQMIALGKRQPGLLNYASTGPGSPSHLYSEKLKAAAGFEATNIAYKGVSEALADLGAGRVHFFALSLATALPMIQDGRAIPLAITSSKRPSFGVDVPTVAEAGFPNASAEIGIGLWAPKNTPRDAVERLNRLVLKALAEPEVTHRLATIGGGPWPMTPNGLDAVIERETSEAKAMALRLGLQSP